MRFKITKSQNDSHTQICTSISWCSLNQFTSISDDNQMLKWNIDNFNSNSIMDFNSYPTSHHWMHGAKNGAELFAVAFVDGSFKIYNKNGKMDKHVTDAHKKSIIVCKWSFDATALATCGQDGCIKIWSKNGSLRSSLVQSQKAIYSFCWCPENDGILYGQQRMIICKPLSSNQRKIQWKAHEGLILDLDWSSANNTIISGSEDCRYKIWDNYGRLLYASTPYDYVINSVSWSPNGEYFAVGAFGMFKLCDKTGWTYSFEKLDGTSVERIAWCNDGTVCAGACGNGMVIFGQVVDRMISYSNWQGQLNDENKIVITDLLTQTNQFLQFKDRVINMSIGYTDMIITTITQCYIFNFTNWNTPHIFDLKDNISCIIQSYKYFCLVENINGIMIYNYDGKLISNPKIVGAKFEFMNRKRISISGDILAVIESSNNKILRFYQNSNGKLINFNIQHHLTITEIHLNQCENHNQRKIAFIDLNRDLYITTINKSDKLYKLNTICDTFLWHDKSDILTSISDSKLYTHFYPNALFIDSDLIQMTISIKQDNDIGRLPQILHLANSSVQIRRKDGGIISIGISPYPIILFEFTDKSKWDKALKLCRFVKQPLLWACLAAVSLKMKQLETAETAFAAIEQPEKVTYISELRENSSEIIKNAALALLFKKNNQAQQIYVQNKYYFKAIMMHINAYRWQRALKLARDNNTCLDIVVANRQKYLKRLGKSETLKDYVKAKQDVGEINWQVIEQKMKEQEQKGKKK